MCLVNKTTNCLAWFLIAVKGIVREKYFRNSRKDEGNTCCEGCKQWVIKGDWQSKQAHLVFFLCILAFSIISFLSNLHFMHCPSLLCQSDVPETPQGCRKSFRLVVMGQTMVDTGTRNEKRELRARVKWQNQSCQVKTKGSLEPAWLFGSIWKTFVF